MLLQKMRRLLGSLSPIQKQGAVSAPKIEIFPHSAILGTRRMVFTYEEGAIGCKITPIFHYVKYNLLFFPQQYSETRASFKIC